MKQKELEEIFLTCDQICFTEGPDYRISNKINFFSFLVVDIYHIGRNIADDFPYHQNLCRKYSDHESQSYFSLFYSSSKVIRWLRKVRHLY